MPRRSGAQSHPVSLRNLGLLGDRLEVPNSRLSGRARAVRTSSSATWPPSEQAQPIGTGGSGSGWMPKEPRRSSTTISTRRRPSRSCIRSRDQRHGKPRVHFGPCEQEDQQSIARQVLSGDRRCRAEPGTSSPRTSRCGTPELSGFRRGSPAELASAMTAFLESFRPRLLADAVVEEIGPGRHLDVTIYQSATAGSVVGFNAVFGELTWAGQVALADLQRFLGDLEDGLTASINVGDEPVVVEGGAETIEIPIGPIARRWVSRRLAINDRARTGRCRRYGNCPPMGIPQGS